MAPKKNSDVGVSNGLKRTHRNHSYEFKLDVIKRIEKGEGHAEVARSLGLSRSTISTFVKQKEKILEVQSSGDLTASIISPKRGVVIVEMERQLKLWIIDQCQKSVCLSQAIITGQAKKLYEDLKNKLGDGAGDVPAFGGSHGWFHRFKKRANLNQLKLAGEIAVNYPEVVVDIIETEDYSPLLDINNPKTVGNDNNSPISSMKEMNLKDFKDIFLHLDKLITVIQKKDTNTERSFLVRRALERATSCYTDLYEEKIRDSIQKPL